MREKVNNTREGVEIDLQKLLLAYLRRWWLIVLCGIVAGTIALFYTMNYVPPKYRAGTTIYVNNYRSDQNVEYISGSNLAASMQLVNTYVNIIKSDTVLDRVVKNADLDYSAEEIRAMMTTEQMDDTEMFHVYITHENPQVAAEVANAIALEALSGIEEFVEGSSAKVIDYAKVPEQRYSPSYSRSGLLGGVVGGVAALIYLTLRYLLDVRIKTSEDLEQMFEIPVLGQIPVFVSPESKTKDGYGYESGGSDEQSGKGR